MSRYRETLTLVPLTVFSLTLLNAQIAGAQETGRDLTGAIGLGISSGPEFNGSDETSAGVFPIFDLTWRDRYFLNQRGLGVYALRNHGPNDLSVGIAIGYDFNERLVADDARLAGLKDVEAGALLTAFAEYDAGIADLEFEVSHGLSSDGHEGTRATAAAEFGMPVGKRVYLSAKPFVTWADGSYTDAFYGVSAANAATSSFSRFEAGSGFERVGVELRASYDLTVRTGVFLGVEHARLLGDAQDSPISFDDSQTEISTGIIFRF
ncbi:MipA/OmpV family protein [uncultured Roseobacter sp.]|uniref:MipA/OmpV family protein n=1 Tax=uncultured Roseobacter sp. TaxID=114847 RepID=UPI00261D0B4A|nr:MipA/OmpV family protein [uncultured Roseobacter sp.]